jgi:predicted RNA methylase
MQDIEPFENPKIELEQYPTSPHMAARLLFTVLPSHCLPHSLLSSLSLSAAMYILLCYVVP